MSRSNSLNGKVAIVTGAGRGIGLEVVRLLGERQVKVLCADIDIGSAEAAAAGVRDGGGEAAAVACDVGKSADVSKLVDAAGETFGKLDLAFNNAGILGPMGTPLDKVDEADWDRTLSINLSSVFYCLKYQVPAMLNAGGGAIVNAASVAGLIAAPRNPVYGATKHAVVGLTRSAAMQYADRGIRINAVCPGIVETGFSNSEVRQEGLPTFPPPFIPMQRFGTPEEIARLVVWLLSDEASYLTGEAVGADGGWRHM
ncbi:MAG: glucose 1-dehydrogenase [Pacificimonas sp.]|jgi:NAD(P)-dependent dehydrogenase (short-subunit alcohol dehydrogenase family)|nr:glucose 1-dehydrogenase [Pacificimonas sp.]